MMSECALLSPLLKSEDKMLALTLLTGRLLINVQCLGDHDVIQHSGNTKQLPKMQVLDVFLRVKEGEVLL